MKQPHLITLGTHDLPKATTFYQNTFQWQPNVHSNENIVFFTMNGWLISLYPWELLAKDIGINPDTMGFRGITLAHNTKTKEDVDNLLNLAIMQGARLVKPAQDVFWGGYSGYFSCPDGHCWEIAWNPHVTFNEDGTLHQ